MDEKMLISTNPANGNLLAEFKYHSANDVKRIVSLADKAQKDWSNTGFSQRSDLLKQVAVMLRVDIGKYSQLITSEMGKPLAQSRAEIEKCAFVCDYYAENAEGFLSNEHIVTDASQSYVSFKPLGVVLAIMPWNFPFWQTFRFAAPAVMAGNGVLLKHASNVTGSALAIEEIFRSSGFPVNLFRVLKLSSSDVGAVIEDPVIIALTITGSVEAGKAVAAKAGSELKKTVLELGGSDPYIILDDADIEAAVPVCVTSRLINGGQSCIAAKRFIVVKSQLAEFEEKFVAAMRSKIMGDPMDENNDIGPQATIALRDELHDQVVKSIELGASCLLGGKIPDTKGAWYPPTVLGNVKPGMPAYDEEIFGPVGAIIEAENEADAIRIANSTQFGLGAAVFTRDNEKGRNIAENLIHAGSCFVNDLVRSDPRLPFGGIGNSGYGRELSHFGIREFVNIKTVYIK